MSPKEEELERRKKLLGDYIIASRKELDEKLRGIDDASKSAGKIFDALYKLGQSNEKEMQEYRSIYQKSFLDRLDEKKEYRSQLAFVSEQIRDLNLKIAEAKAARHPRYQKIYEDTLKDVVFPFKVELTDMVRLENEVGKLNERKFYTGTDMIPVFEAEIPRNENPKRIKPSESEIPENGNGIILARQEDRVETKEPEEIFIPITLTDKPLNTKNGKLLNNPKHIAGGRKFRWTDDRIPDLIGDFLLEHGCIFDYQLKVVQEFFRASKSDRKIVFDGNANQLTTMLYDLKTAKHMAVFVDFLGERIEAVFVRKGDTMRVLIVQKTLVSDFRPGNVGRRTKVSSPYYLDILTYLAEKLKAPE